MLRNVGSNWVLALVTMAATYVLTPFIVHTLGPEGYGTWVLIASMTGYIGLLALGVPMACVRYLAQHVAERDPQKVNQTIGSCAGLYLMIGGVAALLGVALMVLFSVYEVPTTFRAAAHVAFGLMVFQVSVAFVGLLPEGILFAHHDFLVRNLVRAAGVVLRLGLTLSLLMLDASLVVLALIQIACLGFDFSFSWLLIRRRYPEVRLSLADFDRGIVRRIFGFSLYVLLLNTGARLSFETDALVIGAFMSVGPIAFYAVANSLIVYLMDFMGSISTVVAPMATKLNTEGNLVELREMFLRWSKAAWSLTLLAGLFLIVLGPRFIGWWIAPEFEHPAGQVLQILMASSLVFLPVRGVAVPVLMGLGKPKVPALTYLAAGLLNLGLSVLLIRPFGLPGVALGTAIPNVLFALVVVTRACRELEIALPHYVQYVISRAAVGALPVLGLLLWCKHGLEVHGITGLVAAGAAMVLLFGLTWVVFVYRNDPYVDLRPHLVRLLAWSRA